jgi:hypothetical protein
MIKLTITVLLLHAQRKERDNSNQLKSSKIKYSFFITTASGGAFCLSDQTRPAHDCHAFTCSMLPPYTRVEKFPRQCTPNRSSLVYTIPSEFDLQSLFGLHVNSCTHWPRPPPPPHHLGLHRSALLVSQDRRHLVVAP